MSTPNMPHPPTKSILTNEQIVEVDGYVRKFSDLLKSHVESLAEVTKLKNKLDADSLRVEEAKEGRVQVDGKRVTDLNEETLSMHIAKGESSLILSRGRHKQAVADSGRIETQIKSLKTEFLNVWSPVVGDLMVRENKAWEEFFRIYIDSRSLMATLHVQEMASSSIVGALLDSLWRTFHRLRVTVEGPEASAASICLVIATMKGAAKK